MKWWNSNSPNRTAQPPSVAHVQGDPGIAPYLAGWGRAGDSAVVAEVEGEPVGAAWFRLPVGRSKNADPKWLVPLICRLGHVTKKDIGLIKIHDNETKFEISPEVEARFRIAIKAAADAGEIRINPGSAPNSPQGGPQGPRPPRSDGPRPPHAPRPHAGPPRDKPPFKKKGPKAPS